MNSGTKILIGAAATALMAWGAHAAGGGAGFIDNLQKEASAVVAAQGSADVSVAFGRSPQSRHAVLSGNVAPEVRSDLIARISALPGVASARWADIDAAPAAATSTVPEPLASDAVVAGCQADIDAMMKDQALLFDSGSAAISATSDPLLETLAAALRPCAGVVVEVQGHTDLTGNPAANQMLSQARADAVVKALTDRGVPPQRLSATGFGSTQPVMAGTDAAANATNRRTVLAVSGAGTTAAGEPAEKGS